MTEDWQQQNLDSFRQLVMQTVPKAQESLKWGVPVFSYNGKLICAMSTFKNHTKYNFFKGAQLNDNHNLFNSGLDSKEHRSINLAKGQQIKTEHLQQLIRQAAELTA